MTPTAVLSALIVANRDWEDALFDALDEANVPWLDFTAVDAAPLLASDLTDQWEDNETLRAALPGGLGEVDWEALATELWPLYAERVEEALVVQAEIRDEARQFGG